MLACWRNVKLKMAAGRENAASGNEVDRLCDELGLRSTLKIVYYADYVDSSENMVMCLFFLLGGQWWGFTTAGDTQVLEKWIIFCIALAVLCHEFSFAAHLEKILQKRPTPSTANMMKQNNADHCSNSQNFHLPGYYCRYSYRWLTWYYYRFNCLLYRYVWNDFDKTVISPAAPLFVFL